MSEDCIFCKIGQGEVPARILYRDDTTFVVRDINPMAPTHLLVLPVEHVTYLASFTSEREALLGHLALVAKEMAQREGLTEGGYRLVINQGPNSGQEVPHLHLHVLGGRRLGALVGPFDKFRTGIEDATPPGCHARGLARNDDGSTGMSLQ